MIEFLLLFALGFLAAALLALVVAPVIHRRIVKLTERRVRSSVPLSASEIRAEKDVARAAFAAENARLAVDLRERSDRLAHQTAQTARLEEYLGQLKGETLALRQALDEAGTEAGELRSKIRENKDRILTLQGELGAANLETSSLAHEVTSLQDRIDRLGGTIEELRIDVATRDTEAENYKVQLQVLRDERATLREQIRSSGMTSRETEIRLKREQERAAKLDDRLAELISTLSDREQLLERRGEEIARLKQEPGGKAAGQRSAVQKVAAAVAHIGTAAPRDPDNLAEQLRARQAALAERLLKSKDGKSDPALRREIADVATMMIELTALREGPDSPILKILRNPEAAQGGTGTGPSLARRTIDRMKLDPER